MPGKIDDENGLYGDLLLDEVWEQSGDRTMAFLGSLSPRVDRIMSAIPQKIDEQFRAAWSPSWQESHPIAFATALYIPPVWAELSDKQILAGQFIKAEDQLQDEIGLQLWLMHGSLSTMIGLVILVVALKEKFDLEFINYMLYIISVALMSIIPKRIASWLYRSIQELRLSWSTDPEALLGIFQKRRFEKFLAENWFKDEDTTLNSNGKSTKPYPLLDF